MRRAALVVAIVTLLVACSREGSPTVAEPSATSTTTAASPTPSPTTDEGMPAPSPDATAPPGRVVTTEAPAAVPSASRDANGPPGSAAPLFLRPQPATSIVVEVSSNDGAGPSDATLAHITSVLHSVTGKRVSVVGGAAPPSRDRWTAGDLRAAADAPGHLRQGGPAVAHLLFVHGRWSEGDGVLGISVRGDVAAVFVDQVAAASDPLVATGAIEDAVTTHEVGHLLGLVDLYLNTGRDDPAHPGHSTDRSSVMYWAVESTLVTDLLSGGPPREFDDADRADLAAIRGGA